MKKILLFALICQISTIYGQNNKALNSGEIYKLIGITKDLKTNEVTPLVKIEVFNLERKIASTKSDYNGNFHISFCSNKLKNNDLVVVCTEIGFLKETHKFKFSSDSLLIIKLEHNPNNEVSIEEQIENEKKLIKDCGTDELKIEYQKNRNYKHCDGRILTFKELISSKENLNEWEIVDSK